jgi:hypothetical protein
MNYWDTYSLVLGAAASFVLLGVIACGVLEWLRRRRRVEWAGWPKGAK